MLVGQSPEIVRIKRLISQICKTDDNVFITGEVGTGKKHIAREIHSKSRQKNQPFVILDCTAVGNTINQDDLFGVIRESPIGIERKIGMLEQAKQGTLYMENIDELKPEFQDGFYNILRERKFKKKEEDKLINVDFRVIAASTDYRLVRKDTVRKDLLTILNKFTIHISPLRDRRQDIQVLFNYYVEQFCEEFHREIPSVTFELNESILEFDWRGNVSELKNAIRNLVLMSPEGKLSKEFLPFVVKKHPFSSLENLGLSDAVSDVEKYLIKRTLRRCRGNQIKTAKILNVSEAALRYKMKKYGFSKKFY